VGVCDITSRVRRVPATPHLLLRHPCHTAPFLRLFVLNSLTVHSCSFSLKAVLAASSFCPATCSDYSPAVTSSAPFLGLFVPNNSMVQHRITFTLHIHASPIHSLWGGQCFCVTGSSNTCRFSFFRFGGGPPLHSVQSLSGHRLSEDPTVRFAISSPVIFL
jgi:hypothetical protein